MKLLTLFILTTASACSLIHAKTRAVGEKPNVIIMYLDDAGYGDFAHNGNPTIETPTISKLAQEGTNFTQFYVTSPACSVSRYSLITGRYPLRSGFGSWVIGPGSKRHLHVKETTLAELMKGNGYATGMFGKWHMGSPNKSNNMSLDTLPLAHGFDQWVGTNVSHDYGVAKLIKSDPAGNDPIKGYTTLAKNLPSDVKASESLVGLYTKSAVDFIKQNKDQPFFAYVAHNQPHLGVFASDKFKGKSRRGILGDAMAEVDDSLSQIQKALADAGIADNTIIVFASDNGPWLLFQDKQTKKYGDTRLQIGYATPFRDGKGSNWEGGHRVPGIIHWKGKILAQNDVRPSSTLDVLPTLCKLCGIKPPKTQLDGRDISSYLLEKNSPELPFTFAYSNGRNQINALRSGKWKLHVGQTSQLGTNHGYKPSLNSPILFDVEQDLSEKLDRAPEQPEKVEALKKQLLELKERLIKDGTHWDK